MATNNFDRAMMARAIALAKKGLTSTSPNPRVGCVIVKDGEVIGEGYHRKAGEAHAEVNALAAAGDARGASAYVTLEPCSHHGRTGPCAQALVDAGIARVIIGVEDPNPEVSGRGLEILRQAGVEVDSILEIECARLNPGFEKRMLNGLPWVRCKVASSLDGRTAMASGESKWVTGPAARTDVQRWRARSCAIITGRGTVEHDDPALTVRLPGSDRQPLRVVVDSRLRVSQGASIFKQEGETIVACLETTKSEFLPGLELLRLPSNKSGDGVNLRELLKALAARGCNEVLVEAGATLAGAFLSEGLCDEIILYMAPKFLGSTARPQFELPLARMSAQLTLSVTDIRAVGSDWRFTLRPDPEG